MQVLVVLGPLAALVMNGPSYSAIMFLGGSAALVLLIRFQPRVDWHFVWIVSGGIGLYAILAFLHRENVDTYRGHYALLSLYYGLPAGLLFRQLVREGQSDMLVIGFAFMSIGLAVAGYTAVQAAGVEHIVSYTGIGVSRTNIAEDEVFYWRYFNISNVIVGVIPYTVFAVCSGPLFFLSRYWSVKALFALAIALAVYVNILVVTRTTIIAGALATGILLFMQFRSVIAEIRPKKWLLFAMVAVLPVAAVVAYARYTLELGSMLNRFGQSFEDGRLLIWSESIALIPQYPWGGGIDHLLSASWGHNLFLDAGLSTGILGMLALLAVLLVIARRCWQLAGRGRLVTNTADIYMAAIFIGTLLVNMVMPPQVSMMCVTLMFAGYHAELADPAVRIIPSAPRQAPRGTPRKGFRPPGLARTR